ncbi:MAG: ABC transporter permease [Lachnospiraceae bacterium]
MKKGLKSFLTVLEFELTNYVRNKAFLVTTISIAVLGALVMFAPRVPFIQDWLGVDSVVDESDLEEGTLEESEVADDADDADTELDSEDNYFYFYVVYDANNCLEGGKILEEYAPYVKWQFVDSTEAVKAVVEDGEVDAGFVVHSLTECDSYIWNKSMFEFEGDMMEDILEDLNLQIFAREQGVAYEDLVNVIYSGVTINETVLGKDSSSNYWYCYALVIIIFMMIVLYGVMIAQSVTVEKSNRAIEVLVTSTNTNYLLFGKVLAGAIAGVLQVGVILLAILGSYQLNRSVWGNLGEFLDMFLNIPADVLVTFAFFGIGGYLFYAFLYGAVGALVSKTEDISKSASGLQMIIMIAYFVALMQLSNVDGVVMKIASFLPFTSYTAMFARVAMGNVALWEILLSGVILVVSIVGVGFLGAGLYRMGTLRYGNPVKFSTAVKALFGK